MLVYRVQHRENGYGPYSHLRFDNQPRCWVAGKKITRHHNTSGEHPSVKEDVPGLCHWFEPMPDHLFCGFRSQSELLHWFRGHENRLVWAGYIVAAYDVDISHVKFGSKQLVFDMSKAKLVKRISIKRVQRDLTAAR